MNWTRGQRHRCDQQQEARSAILNSIKADGMDCIYVAAMSAIKAPRQGRQSKLGVSSLKLANIAVVNIRHPAIVILGMFGGKAPVLKYAVWRSEQ